MIDAKKVPKELLKNRDAIECNFIFCLYKDPLLMMDYEQYAEGVNKLDILTEDGKFYYELAWRLYRAGYRVFDHISIYEYLSDKEPVREQFENRGGFKTVQEITSLLSTENVNTYFDELSKSNLLIYLDKNGFDVLSELDKFKEMNCEEVYSYFEYKLNTISIGKIDSVQAEDLSTGYDSYIDEWDKGTQVGFRIGFPLLNYQLAGVHKENLLLHMAHIGNGKTTTSILFYVLPAIENGQNVCIIGNEQSESEFRQMVLATVMFNKVRYFGMNRQKIIFGHYSEEQREALKAASDWLEAQPGKLKFVPMPDYSINRVKKIVRRYSSIGYELFIFDTLKPEQESSDKAWALLSDVAKELFLLAKKQKVAIIATAQLSSESMARKYLDLSCIGKSRAIAETATQVVMFRTLRDDEKEKLKVYTFGVTDDSGGKKIKKIQQLDADKDYIVLFTPKNRFGNVSPQLVYQRNMNFNTYYEVGYCDVPYDGYLTRK